MIAMESGRKLWVSTVAQRDPAGSPAERTASGREQKARITKGEGDRGARMQTEIQKLTLECPVKHQLAKVEVRCRVLDNGSEKSRGVRILEKIVSCTFATPEIGCHPACEAAIRHLVEY